MSELVEHPGYRCAVTSTKHWAVSGAGSVEGPFAWVWYGEPDEHGMAERHAGYAVTWAEAERLAGFR